MLHRFATLVAGCTVLLVLAGSLVTSTGSGLSVPDWPTTYGWSMLTFPLSKMVGGILYEHGHRLIASAVGVLTVVLAIWLWAREPRRWMKWLGAAALAAIVVQGVLGGLTVLFFLPASISTAHAGLAELFLCLAVAIALFTSPGWLRGYDPAPTGPGGVDDARLRALASATTALVYAQILLGAVMRHTGAGLAIPDFPLAFGHVLPPMWDARIGIHFAHRVGAGIVTLAVLATAGRVWSRHRGRRELVRPAGWLLLLLVAQLTLGALTVLTRKDVSISSAHVVGGALVLATSLALTLRAWRCRFGQTVAVHPPPETASDWFAQRFPLGPKRPATGAHA